MAEPLQVLDAHPKYGLPLAFTRNGKALMTGGFNGSIRVFSTQTWKETTRLSGHDQSVNCGCVGAGGILVTGSTDTTVRLWELTDEDARNILHGHKKTVTALTAHPNRPIVASASYDKTVRLWDLEEEDEIALLKGHEKNVTAVRFLDDGLHLVSGGLGGEAVVWDIEDEEEAARIDADDTAVAAIARDGDGGFWTAGHSGRLRRWSADGTERAAIVLPDDAAPTGIAVHPENGRLAVTADHAVHLYDPEGRLIDTHELKPKGIYAPRFSFDGRMLAVGGADGKVRIYG